jgi:hypothetical protein
MFSGLTKSTATLIQSAKLETWMDVLVNDIDEED